MVFINEVLEQNRRKLAEDKAATEQSKRPVIPVRSRFIFDLDEARDLLQERLRGQPKVLEQLLDALAFIKADIADKNRPLWSALLLGPTGVGKTESAKLLARILTGSEDNLCRIDMNTLSQSHYSAAITGAPPGYVGSKEGINLFDENLIAGDLARPGVVLLDEIEKASDEVHMALLSVLEDGYLTLTGTGKKISFRNSVILMTSNIGARLWETTRAGRFISALRLRSRRQARVLNAVTQKFPPEFFNRIDRVMMFELLSENAAKDILMLELTRLNQRLLKKNWSLTLQMEVYDKLLAKGFSARYGARSVRRMMRDDIEIPLASFLLAHNALATGQQVRKVEGVWEQGEIRFRL